MTTQKYMGRHQLVERLAAQVGSKETAISILQKRGQLEADGKTLTKAGQKRDNMTARERALDRATKESGRTPSEYKYDPKTNRATLRK
jgi:phage FluMu protein gp41